MQSRREFVKEMVAGAAVLGAGADLAWGETSAAKKSKVVIVRDAKLRTPGPAPNEKRVAEDRPDCYWLYVVTNCESEQPLLNEPIPNPAKMPWIEVKKVEHYYLTLSAISVASTDPRLYPEGRR